MKHRIKKYLQRLLGIENYLFIFALFKIKTLKWDRVEGEFLHFLALVPLEGIVLDIGANIGIMTILFAQNAKNRTVYSFEPMPVNFKTLQRVISWFKVKNVHAHRWALGNQDTEIEMIMPEVNSVKLQGLSHVIDTDTAIEEGERVKVQSKRLDDVEALFDPNSRITAIKIDVQGYEYFVFDGARKLLERYRPIVYCELGEDENRRKTLELFHNLSYDVKVWDKDSLQDFRPVEHANYWNFFLIPRQMPENA